MVITRQQYKWMSKSYKEEVTDEDFRDDVEDNDQDFEMQTYQMDTLEEIESSKTKIYYDARDKCYHPEWADFPKPDRRRY